MNQNHLNRIDVLRAIAILLVFAHHYWLLAWPLTHAATGEPLPDGPIDWMRVVLMPAEIGYLGVKLFFVISGFCIHYSFLNWKEQQTGSAASLAAFLPGFFWRRFWRIYPPYFLALTVFYLCAYAHPLSFHALKHFAVHGLLINNLFPAFFYNINPSFWSIAVEWQLYLVYPLLLWVTFAKGAKAAFCAGSAIALSIHIVAPHWTSSFLVLKSPFAFWFEWIIGAVLAETYVQGRKVFRWHRALLAILLTWLLLAYHSGAWEVSGYFAAVLLFAVLVEYAIHARRSLAVWEEKLVPIGLCSYSLYLLHQPILLGAIRVIPLMGMETPILWTWGVLPLTGLTLIMMLSWAYYRWIEIPSITLGKQAWGRIGRARGD